MTDHERAITPEEEQCIKDTLKRLGYFSDGDTIETHGGAMTGVAGRSRVFMIHRRSPNGTSQRFVAKFDKSRTAKELEALAKLHSTNFPTNFLMNLDGKSGLKKMPAKNRLILYKAADSVTLNHEVLSLQQYLLKYAATSQADSIAIFTKALDSLSLLYRQAASDKPNQIWSHYFPQVAAEDKFLYKNLTGKTVSAAIEKCDAQIGNQALAPIHGDLNHTNILVAMQNQAPRDVVFIDFADYREKAPIVLDFVKLETELWLETAADHPGVQGELEQRLAALIADPAAVVCNHPALRTYAQLAQAIRERAMHHMGSDNFKACYGEPLVYAFLRAMTYPSIKGDKFKARLAQQGAQAAWEWFEQVPVILARSKKPGQVERLPKQSQPVVNFDLRQGKTAFIKETTFQNSDQDGPPGQNRVQCTCQREPESDCALIKQPDLERIKYILDEMGRWDEGDNVVITGSPMTGVAGKSRVQFFRHCKPTSEMSLVAKFDQRHRTEKEFAALGKINFSDFPPNFLVNLDGTTGLKKMPAEHCLILYKAANGITFNQETQTLRDFFRHQAKSNHKNCLEAMNMVLKCLSNLYEKGKKGNLDQIWEYYFPEVFKYKTFLLENAGEKHLVEAIGSVSDPIGKHHFSPIHGDLNLANILVAVLDANVNNILFIDFADYNQNAPVVLDFVKMETDLWLEAVNHDLGTKEQAELEDKIFDIITNPGKVECNYPKLTCYVKLTHQLRVKASEYIAHDFDTVYGVPLALGYLRAISYEYDGSNQIIPSPISQKIKYALAAAEAAWKMVQQARGGLPQVSMSTETQPPSQLIRQKGAVLDLVTTKIKGILSKQCFAPFLHGLMSALGGEGQAEEMPALIARLMVKQTISSVQGCLVRHFEDADYPETGNAWNEGLSILGWLVIANVDERFCENLKQGSIFNLPLQTLLGAEIIVSWHDRRPAELKLRGKDLVGECCVGSIPESGPNDEDFVSAVANQLCDLFNLNHLDFSNHASFKELDGLLSAAQGASRPYYLVVDAKEARDPLNQEVTKDSLHKCLKHLNIVYLLPGQTPMLKLLIEEEQILSGVLKYYIGRKEVWRSRHS